MKIEAGPNGRRAWMRRGAMVALSVSLAVSVAAVAQQGAVGEASPTATNTSFYVGRPQQPPMASLGIRW